LIERCRAAIENLRMIADRAAAQSDFLSFEPWMGEAGDIWPEGEGRPTSLSSPERARMLELADRYPQGGWVTQQFVNDTNWLSTEVPRFESGQACPSRSAAVNATSPMSPGKNVAIGALITIIPTFVVGALIQRVV